MEPGDRRAVTSIQERWSHDFSIPQLFHSEYSIISFIFSSTTGFSLILFILFYLLYHKEKKIVKGLPQQRVAIYCGPLELHI